MSEWRIERDTMGEMRVPAHALYGPQTQRAVENFPISGQRLPRAFLRAMGLIKAAAARMNANLGHMDANLAGRIAKAADEVASGKHDDQFVIDVYQTGSGTSTNMNANEVIGKLAGAHPNDHVNYGQSSNDVIPTAIHVAGAEAVHRELLPAMYALAEALEAKASESSGVIKIGRTHLQDAVPMRLGQEFSGYAAQVRNSAVRMELAVQGLYELPLGGTAIGTGLNAAPGFAAAVISELARQLDIPFREAGNHFEAQAAKDAVVFLSGALRTYAVALTKIANDIRWLVSLGEIIIPAVQPGSSIMPGKVNPVIAESVLMACAQVIGYDATIAWCGAAGNFELNVMMPVMAYDLLESVSLLTAVSKNFEQKCINGIAADAERAGSFVEHSLAMVTVLAPVIGYEKAATIAKEAHATKRTVREVAREKSGLDEATLTILLDPATQAGQT